jgi:hypothetical protein
VCLGSFTFIFYEFKWVSLGCLGDPYGCPWQDDRQDEELEEAMKGLEPQDGSVEEKNLRT